MSTVEKSWQPPDGSWASSARTRHSMLSNRSRDTKPELAVRRLVHAAGLRYRVAARPLPGSRRTADLVFTRRKVAVFIDGCFWHSCREHGTLPNTNSAFWQEKLSRTAVRDRETNALLQAEGWTVLRFFEHDAAEDIAAAIIQAVGTSVDRANERG